MIPINSPIYKAPYNGAIEHAQGEFKNYLRHWKSKASTIGEYGLLAEIAAHGLNHRSRRCLKGRVACRVYFGNNRIRYSKRQRKLIYDWIFNLATEISIQAGKSKPGREKQNLSAGVAGGSKTMVGEKWLDQNPKGRKSVTPFFFRIVL